MVIRIPRYRFSIDEFHRMVTAGVFDEDDRVELIEGEVLEKSPIGPEHAVCVDKLNLLLGRRLGRRAILRVQSPIQLGRRSEPQPDLSILRPPITAYEERHPGPGDVLFVIEVADTTVESDRELKLPFYARKGIVEAWLVDLPGQAVEVHRSLGRRGYAEVRRLERGAHLLVAGVAGCRLGVSDIL